jgi:hypothetical protein
MEKLEIRSLDDLLKTIEKAMQDASILKDKKIVIAPELKTLSIHLEGGYDSTITPTVMRSILAIQDSIYDLYSQEKYGQKKRLASEEREAVELVASVKPGSTSVEVFLGKALEVFSTMTGQQALIGIGILGTTFLIAALGKRAFDYHEKILEVEQRAKETEGYQKLVATAFTTSLEGQRDFMRIIAKEPFAALSLNGELVDRENIKEQIKTPRAKKLENDVVYSGPFKITDIHIAEDGTFIDAVLLKKNLEIRNINILADYIQKGDYQWLKDAVQDGKGKPVTMKVIAHYKGDQIEHAYLQSFEK